MTGTHPSAPSQAVHGPFSLEKIPGLLSETAAIKQSHYVFQHVECMKKVAKENNTYIMFRPLNEFSTSLLQDNQCAAKGPEIKGKSSSWGPMAGYIPYDPRLNKKRQKLSEDENPNKFSLEKHKDLVVKTPLVITRERFGELSIPVAKRGLGVLSEEDTTEFNGHLSGLPKDYKTGKLWASDKEDFVFAAVNTGEGHAVYYAEKKDGTDNKSLDFKPVEVMAEKSEKNPNGKPYTADYDTFAFCPSLAKFEDDSLPRGDLSQSSSTVGQSLWGVVQTRFGIEPPQKNTLKDITHKLVERLLNHEARSKDGEGPFNKEMRDKLNAALREGGSLPLIKHGAETDNHYYFEKDDNILIISPYEEVFCTQNWDQVQAASFAIKGQGYAMYSNAVYNLSPVPPGTKVPVQGYPLVNTPHTPTPTWDDRGMWAKLVRGRDMTPPDHLPEEEKMAWLEVATKALQADMEQVLIEWNKTVSESNPHKVSSPHE